MNGSTLPDDFWTRLDERFDKLHEKLDGVNGQVNNINANGCAQRTNDIKRLDSLETWRDRTVGGVILALVGALMQFLGIRPS